MKRASLQSDAAGAGGRPQRLHRHAKLEHDPKACQRRRSGDRQGGCGRTGWGCTHLRNARAIGSCSSFAWRWSLRGRPHAPATALRARLRFWNTLTAAALRSIIYCMGFLRKQPRFGNSLLIFACGSAKQTSPHAGRGRNKRYEDVYTPTQVGHQAPHRRRNASVDKL